MFSKIFRIFKKKIDSKTAEEWYRLALIEIDPAKKVEYYTKVLEIDPENFDAWFNKGLALVDLGRYSEAIECFDKALEIEPGNTAVQMSREIAICKYEESHRKPYFPPRRV